MLDALSTVRREEQRGVLLCRVSVSRDREWDSSGLFDRNTAPDVSAYVRIDGGSEIRARLAEDTYEGVLSVPSVVLVPTSRLAFRLVDRDVSVDDPIAEVELAWPRETPVAVANGPVTLRCGVLDEREVRPRATAALAAADRLLDAAERQPRRVDLMRDALDLADAASRPLQAAIREAASFLGYAHADVSARLGRLASVEARQDSVHRAAVVDALADAPLPGTEIRLGRDVRVTLRGIECRPADAHDPRPSCTLRVGAEYGRIPTPPGFVAPVEATLLLADRQPIRCARTMHGGDAFVRTIGPASHAFECRVEYVPDESSPILVRIDSGRSRALLRAR